jgi:hypothetical protein
MLKQIIFPYRVWEAVEGVDEGIIPVRFEFRKLIWQ